MSSKEGDMSSDDEVENSSSPKLEKKKLKLNDGSSQESVKDAGSSTPMEKDDNVDSGVSADKSESISSDDRAAGASAGPSNEVVNVAPSTSNVHNILLNITCPRQSRNYRKRKTPGGDSDSNDSSQDSDDLSTAESPQERPDNTFSDSDDDNNEYLVSVSGGSPSSAHVMSDDSNNSSYDLVMQSEDTDSEEEPWARDLRESTRDYQRDNTNKTKPPDVLLKQRPPHNYQFLRELINREMGLTFPVGKASPGDVMFTQKFYGSLHTVYRLSKLHTLNKHRGCVNCINFHPEGHLLASGSDDTNVIIWDWARNKSIQTIKTGHKSNVFQSKFLYLNAKSQLNIVTCARDGVVRLLQCAPSGGREVSRRKLASHSRAAHKVHVSPHEPHVVISAGEDGVVMHCDVRNEHATRLFHCRSRNVSVPLYSVTGHPFDPNELMVAGRDKFVRVYDRRHPGKTVATYCPKTFEDRHPDPKRSVRLSLMHLTCAVYNHDGTEILASYNDEDIYLFNAKTDVYDKEDTVSQGYTHKYSGHRNNATFKGVSFFGPNSQYIVSGSDCSYIYVWEKESEAIVQWLHGDFNGVVNCIETHPRCPVMATSGLDKDVKIWMPKSHVGDADPTFDGLERVVRENVSSQLHSPLFNDFLPTLYSAWRGENLSDDENPLPYGNNVEFDGNVCTTF